MNRNLARALKALLESLKQNVATLDANPATKPLADAVKAAETARKPVVRPVRKEP